LADSPQCHVTRTLPVSLDTHSVAITRVHLDSYFYIPFHFTLLVYQTAETQECILNPRYTVECSCSKLTLPIMQRLLGKQSLRHASSQLWREEASVEKGEIIMRENVIYWVLTTVTVKITTVWAVTQAKNLLTFRKYLQHPSSGRNHYSHILQMETARSFKTLVNFYQTTRRHIPQDSTLCNTLWRPTDLVALFSYELQSK